MENATAVGKNALQYRLIMNEVVGFTITIALTVLIGITLYLLKLKGAIFIDTATFIVVFILQFALLYFFSFMQYKNLKYTIGQNAVSFQRGTFTIERETIPFEKIKSSLFDQSFFQRLFSVGDITIEQEDEKYIWEDIDSMTANLISNAVSAKGDVQPITVATANAAVNSQPPATNL
jgi:uncharacterized membrane protein YdbT with pleckstrin-like domain